ncbi:MULTISPECIES: ABC transporter ATP-binding protein [Acinetobacter]|jgi:NitT/TauT family transport system ATP-binding protein|uniref:ABC transporter ATP-binding protein n=1 Tax=Acinetobacter TaxID=469 RepID=UPI00192B954A|nr:MULTISPECIES: ABC transporter ATP-binding protein [Acinetobacter]
MRQYGHIHLNNINLHLGQDKQRFQALDQVSFDVQAGEFVCLLGPSGCGKSTLLGALAGHLPISSGSMLLDQKTIEKPSSDRGLVFQQHTLFPWKSVLDNVCFGLKMKGISRAQRQEQAAQMIELVGLKGFEHQYPAELSGGMQQRVEIARVLINQPRVLLMDEPFGALDAQTRLKMQELLLEIWQSIQTSVLFITHDIDEALFLADRVLIMSHRPGRIIEEIKLDFPRPRHVDLVTSTEFTQIKKHCIQVLKQATQTELSRLNPLGLNQKAAV